MILVISASCPESRSRILADTAKSKLLKKNATVEVFILEETLARAMD